MEKFSPGLGERELMEIKPSTTPLFYVTLSMENSPRQRVVSHVSVI